MRETTTKNPRARYHHGDLREALLAAGREVLAERGPTGFTLRECARRAGVSHAAPAHHFPTAADLLSEIAAIGFEELTRSMLDHRRAAEDRPAPERLRAIGRGYVAFALANPAVFRLMFRCDTLVPGNAHLRAAGTAAYECLLNEVAGCPGADRTDRRDVLAALAWSTVHGFATLALEGQFGPVDPAAQAARLEAVLRAQAPAFDHPRNETDPRE